MNKLLTTAEVLAWALDVCHAERDTFYGEDSATAARLAQGQRLLEAFENAQLPERGDDLWAFLDTLYAALKEP